MTERPVPPTDKLYYSPHLQRNRKKHLASAKSGDSAEDSLGEGKERRGEVKHGKEGGTKSGGVDREVGWEPERE